MNYFKKYSLTFATLFILLLSVSPVYAITEDSLYIKAERLRIMGILKGSDKGFDLDKAPNRAEAAVIIVRILGKENELKNKKYGHPFKDVPAWASSYVGYLYQKNLANGLNNNTYGSMAPVTQKQFTAMVLRALGYNDKLGDFNWADPFSKAEEIGLNVDIDEASFNRGGLTAIIYEALTVKLRGKDATLIEKLIYENSINEKQLLEADDEKLLSFINSKAMLLDNLIVLVDKTYDQDEVHNIISRISNISHPILKGLVDDRVTIRLINEPITDDPNFSYLKGVTPRGWEGTGKTWDDIPGAGGNPTIIRVGYSEKGKGHGTINLELHEIGHAADGWVFEDVSKSDEFKSIWKKEVSNLFKADSYFNSYSEEYFAEVFAMYFLNDSEKEKVRKSAPRTYDFFNKLEKCTSLE